MDDRGEWLYDSIFGYLKSPEWTVSAAGLPTAYVCLPPPPSGRPDSRVSAPPSDTALRCPSWTTSTRTA
eukprot:SAG22_NODE_10380_length_538_cov_1.410023_1_plen_68_part_01